MRILHASDLLLGMSFPHAAERAEELRAARLEALRSLLALAGREEAGLLLLAGNTLADNRQSAHELVSILKTSPVPVYLLPGLTDPYTPDSPYLAFPPEIQVLSEPTPVVLEGLTLLPFPVRSREQPPDFSLTHGTALGVACARPREGPYGLRYVAMGGSPQPLDDGPLHWCGTPESYQPGQAGQAVLIDGATGRSIPTGRVSWPAPQPTAELPPLRHPLLQQMEAQLARHDDPAVARRALERLHELAAELP